MEQQDCPISGKPLKWNFSETVLAKYKVNYFYCDDSGLLRTEEPYWLDESYQNAIADTDTGIAARNCLNCSILTPILHHLFKGNGRFLDIAGGYGLLTRLMRDAGFDCYSTDRYCANIFAPVFEPTEEFFPDAIFAFEVFEHVHDPMQFLKDVFDRYRCKTVIFSTQTFLQSPPSNNWWYYSFETGQHITFFQPRTLSMLAKRLNCNYYMLSPTHHIITERELSRPMVLVLRDDRLRGLYSLYVNYKRRGKSLTWDDHLKIKKLIGKR